MKKALLVVTVVALAAVIFGAGVVFAQYGTASAQGADFTGRMGMGMGGGMHGRGGYGPMHDYVEQALAEKLGQTEDKIETQLAAGKTMAQIALAWELSKPVVTAPIIGATKPYHLADAAAAVSVKLSSEEVQLLEEVYQPHPVLGYV